MVKHIDTLGILMMVYGAFQAFVGIFLIGIYLLMGVGFLGIGAAEGDEEMMVIGGITTAVSIGIGLIVLGFASLPIFAGVGIRRRAPWGRILGFVAGALALMNMPMGTALGIFAFMALLDADVAKEFEAA